MLLLSSAYTKQRKLRVHRRLEGDTAVTGDPADQRDIADHDIMLIVYSEGKKEEGESAERDGICMLKSLL